MPSQPFLTERRSLRCQPGNPKPFTLKGRSGQARLTPETCRLEVVSDGSATLAKQLTIAMGRRWT